MKRAAGYHGTAAGGIKPLAAALDNQSFNSQGFSSLRLLTTSCCASGSTARLRWSIW